MIYKMIIIYENHLQHHGIKGQRWGVRRYRKKDGSLTPAGKKRYSMSEDAIKASDYRKKKVSQLTNKELRELNERTNLENNYKRLHPNNYKKALAIAGSLAGSMGTITALYKNGNALMKIGKKAEQDMVKKIGSLVVSELNKHPFKF